MRVDKPEDMAVVLRRQGPPGARVLVANVLAGLQLRPDQPSLLLRERELWDTAARALGPAGELLVAAPRAGTQVLVHGHAWIPAEQTDSRARVELRLLAAPDGAGDAGPALGSSASTILLDKSIRVQAPAPSTAASPVPVPVPELGPVPVRAPTDRAARGEAVVQADAWLSGWPHANATQAPAAPPDQCLAQELRGDEILEWLHLHPQHPRLRGALAGLRPICRWELPPDAARAGDASSTLLPLRACTLWLFPATLRGIVVFEARVVCAHAHDLKGETLHARWEPCARSRQASPAAMRLPPAASAPAPLRAAAPAGLAVAPEAAPRPPSGPGMGAEDLRRQMGEEARQELRAQGWPQARLDELDATGWMGGNPEPDASLDDLIGKLEAQTDGLLREHGIDDATLQRFLTLAERDAPPGAEASASTTLAQALRQLDAASRKALADAGLDEQRAASLLRSRHPEAADTLESLLRDRPAPPTDADTADAESPAPGTEASDPATAPPEPANGTMSRGRVRRHLREGLPLRGTVLDGLDLRGLDFSGADLREVRARSTVLAACAMRGVDLRGALLHDADLRGADLHDARLGGSSCARACLDQACLDGADCSEADFTQASLAEASMRSALLRRCVLEQTDLRGAQAARCDAEAAQFSACLLDHGDWRGARLRSAAWLDCSLSHLRADQTDAQDLCLHGSNARAAVFEQADLRGSRASDSSRLVGARLRGADLRGACWDGCLLAAADLSTCRLDGASLARVRARLARMPGVHASSLRLDEADLRGVDLRGAKLFEAGLCAADLRGARLDGALCFGADLADVRATASTWRGADLRRTVLAARAAAVGSPTESGA